MFDHSIKVPRLYKTTAKIYRQVKEGTGSLKQLVYEKKHPNIKAIYALVVEAIHRDSELNKLIERSEILKKEPRFDPWLARILITELLFGKLKLPGESKPIKTVLAYEQIFKAHNSDIVIPKSSEVNQVNKPRYVRVNTLSCTVNEAIENFSEEGWVLSKHLDNKDYTGFLEKIIQLNEDEFIPDIHIPNLLIFPIKTQFYRHPAYKNGQIILQDKASCLPVHILAPPPGSVVLDMCAAPGMKTTQVAAILNDQGLVYAVEKDERRFKTLEKIVESSKATCIKCFNKDILTCDNETFPNVEYILVDPSCSGSGLTDRLTVEEKQSQFRLNKLAGFQIKILRAALTRYPNAKRVVYSTCSTYLEENEDVVRQVLETNLNFKLVEAKQFVNNAWLNFGSEDFGEMGKFCLYAKPELDLTNGFFVAVFERVQEGEENMFFNKKNYNYKKYEQDKKRRGNFNDEEYEQENTIDDDPKTLEEKPKRRKKNKLISEQEIPEENNEERPKKKKKNKSISKEITEENNEIVEYKKKKKKKSKHLKEEILEEKYEVVEEIQNEKQKILRIKDNEQIQETEEKHKPKKKKSKSVDVEETELKDPEGPKKKKHKKKDKE
ncbi:unnamed protein product [Brassicogethes aeneus]|uniref:SAM-dependent MTase RsmB/NOP-type domain-containing protein n=1 Tax=Brassicogethes aeneus TaxID=1431903 RepID=A0A9P0B2V1_BRAAE|nr:unnamed protein product [Brassicogethes aeneus]